MRRANVSGGIKMLAVFLLFTILLGACGESAQQSANKSPATNSSVYTTPYPAANAASNTSAKPMADMKEASRERSSDGERYAEITENPFLEANRAPLSTFSIDVDTASYTNVRRFLRDGQLPPKDAVRIEEMINYFEYDYPQPAGPVPFSVNTEVATAPWNPEHKVVMIGLQGKKMALENTPPSNLVFLVDVSGSMGSPDKLPLLKQGLRTMVNQLSSRDRVAIVVYAGASGLALSSTPASNRGEIIAALERLESGGSTNGGSGIKLAYRVATENFIRGGNNRVILATDGDFNVGMTNDSELVELIERQRETGVYLSVLGFGTGNLNDSMMERLADKGNGNYAYIDSVEETRKALGEQVAGTLFTIAKDVKVQVEFNPAKVEGYRLIGYENRLLANRDFNDDRKDAGEIGAGHSVTALYEIVPKGGKIDNPGVGELRYGSVEPSDTTFGDEMLTVKLRYKDPNGSESKLLTMGLLDQNRSFESASENLRFASSVAAFGMILRDSKYKGKANFDSVWRMANGAVGNDLKAYRSEFLGLVQKAATLGGRG